MDNKLTIGEKIWEIAEGKGFTKTSLVKDIGISRQTLYSWIKGKTSPTHDELIQVSKILNTNLVSQSPKNITFEESGATAEIAHLKKVIELLESRVKDKDAVINMHKQQIAELDEKIATLKSTVKDKDEAVSMLRGQVVELQKKLDNLNDKSVKRNSKK